MSLTTPNRGNELQPIGASRTLGSAGQYNKPPEGWLRETCDDCKAKRYEKCYQWQGLAEGRYLVDMATPHESRLKKAAATKAAAKAKLQGK